MSGERPVRTLQRAPRLVGVPRWAGGGETDDGRHAGGAGLRKNRKNECGGENDAAAAAVS
jgi:hypothetical protein